MSKVIAGITTSVDGYFTGPDDGPGRGLGGRWRAAALYPPFRLDTGGPEPRTTPPSPPPGPTEGGDVPTQSDLSRV